MQRTLQIIAVSSIALFAGGLLGAAQLASALADVDPGAGSAARPAGAQYRPPPDPKKKMPGDPCKTSDECQQHHSCEKVGDQMLCKAPPPPRLPPGAVT